MIGRYHNINYREIQTFVNTFSILVDDFFPQNDPVRKFFLYLL